MAQLQFHPLSVGFNVLIICMILSLFTANWHLYATEPIKNAFGDDNGKGCNACHTSGPGTKLNDHGVKIATTIAQAKAAIQTTEIKLTTATQPEFTIPIEIENDGPSRKFGPMGGVPARDFQTAVQISSSTLTASIEKISGTGFTAGGSVVELAGDSRSNKLFIKRNTDPITDGLVRITLKSNKNSGGNLSGELPEVVLTPVEIRVMRQVPTDGTPPSAPTGIIIR